MDDHDRHECDRRAGDDGGRGCCGGEACSGARVDGREAEEGAEGASEEGGKVSEACEEEGCCAQGKEASEGEEGSAKEVSEAARESDEGRGAEDGQDSEATQGEGACDGQAQEDVHSYGEVHRDSDPPAARDAGRNRRGLRGKGDRNAGGVGSADDQQEAGDQVLTLSNALADIAMVLYGQTLWCVVHGDCLQILTCLPARSIDHVVTDPPYETEAHTLARRLKSTSNRGGVKWTRKGGRIIKAPLPFAPMTEADRLRVGAEFGRLARRWAVVFCQIEAVTKWSEAIAEMRYMRACIVDKYNGPQMSGDRPGMGYETIVTMHAPGKSRWNGGGRNGMFRCNTHDGANTDADGERLHPTQKPIALMLELIQLFTDPGELVIDPYCGSGTTGAACVRLGRRFIGIEKDATWARTATDRLEAESRSQGLAEHQYGQTSIFDKVKS